MIPDSQPIDSLEKLQLRVQKLRVAKMLAAVIALSKTSDEILPKVISQLRPISQLLSDLNVAIIYDKSILDGIDKVYYFEFKKLSTALTDVAESLEKLNYFNSKALQDLVFQTMHLCYGVEAEIKLKAYEHQPMKKSEDEFKRALSANGMRAISKRI